MKIKVIDSFNTLDVPDIINPFEGKSLTKKESLDEELRNIALTVVQSCKCKLRDAGEDIDIGELKEVAKIVMDTQKAFFDNKQSSVTVNNVQNNISNTQLSYFKGILKDDV